MTDKLTSVIAHAIVGYDHEQALLRGCCTRSRCSCGWRSDLYAEPTDAQRAGEVHVRRAARADFDALLARSSVGAALADVRARGIAAHLADLEREMRSRRRRKSRAVRR